MASEKVIPAITAIAVITSCITLSSKCLMSVQSLLPTRRARAAGFRLCDFRRLTCLTAEDFGDLFIPLSVDLHRVAHTDHREELHNVPIAHADAAMRGRLPDRPRRIRAVNAVSLSIESDPARAERIIVTGRDDDARVVVGRFGQAPDDLERSRWTWADIGSNRDFKNPKHCAVLHDDQFSIGNAHDHLPLHTNRTRRRVHSRVPQIRVRRVPQVRVRSLDANLGFHTVRQVYRVLRQC